MTALVILGKNRAEALEHLQGFHVLAWSEYGNPEIIQSIYLDPSLDEHELIVICTDLQSSKRFLASKYDEKALLRHAEDKREQHAPTVTWTEFHELPSLIERLERNISDHANF